ncbi:DUF6716 putative glycosyltransferase [Demequina aurantiaca]|uniref:DUF6716 putative glycosyltransferase n=1 Tax=Demequina aurantiaca TaxID=676200 RepID=UPI000B29CC5A|nr:DUF6716 putative glycosyltransferase [Demequina aurantiaca]
MRALVLADSDSYLKWGVSRARDLPSEWEVEVVVVRNSVTPSSRQRADAVAGRWVDVPVIAFAQAKEKIQAGVDVLVLACRGPLIEFLFTEILTQLPERPVIVTGIPGLWFPPTRRGLDFRADADMLVVHSRHEREAVDAANRNGGPQVTLATLIEHAHPGAQFVAPRTSGAVVFAPQALVPGTRAERRRLLDGLVHVAQENPSTPVLVKLRGDEDEAQTHSEFASFPALARELRVERPRNLRFVRGALSTYLDDARGLVTVSSTAALEAVGMGVPTMVLRDFGVSADNLNLVFEGSGLWGDLDRLARLDFPEPDPCWMYENYFHDAHESNWVQAATALAEDRSLLADLRERRPVAVTPAGARGKVRRMRVRAQALGSADTRWRRLSTGLIIRPALAAREVVVRGERARSARSLELETRSVDA